MSIQPQKAYWKMHPDEYHRHNVEFELTRFIGWKTLLEIIEAAEDIQTSFVDQQFVSDWIAIDFAEAARINESVMSKVENFIEYSDYFEVIGLPVIKRFEKIGQTIICKRCGFENSEYNMECEQCKANLHFAGKRKYVTRSKELYRLPFKIPKKEPTTNYLIRRLQIAKENKWEYLFFNPHTQKPITDSCFYMHYTKLGKKLGIDLWPHRNRAERCKQLREEYEFTKDDLRRFTMIVADRTLEIYAGTSVTYEQKMGIKT